jgi:hypothetical protein
VALSCVAVLLSIAYGAVMGYLRWSMPIGMVHLLSTADEAILLLVVIILNCILFFHRLLVAKTSQAAHNLKQLLSQY